MPNVKVADEVSDSWKEYAVTPKDEDEKMGDKTVCAIVDSVFVIFFLPELRSDRSG